LRRTCQGRQTSSLRGDTLITQAPVDYQLLKKQQERLPPVCKGEVLLMDAELTGFGGFKSLRMRGAWCASAARPGANILNNNVCFQLHNPGCNSAHPHLACEHEMSCRSASAMASPLRTITVLPLKSSTLLAMASSISSLAMPESTTICGGRGRGQ